MDIGSILVSSLWAGCFAASLGVVLGTLPRMLVPCFVCGFTGRFVRVVLTGFGLGQNASVVVASAACVVVAYLLAGKRQDLSTVALVTGILPLGASVALFNAIGATLKTASGKADSLTVAPEQLVAGMSVALVTTIAIVLGLFAGSAILWPFRHRASAQTPGE
jgi:uncharacterized membrane protein YjjB (DUF3815 family)